jgi:hypothetical protein
MGPRITELGEMDFMSAVINPARQIMPYLGQI